MSSKAVVVAGTSLEPASDDAVRTAARIAERAQAALHLVHAHPMPAAYLAAPRALGPLYAQLVQTEKRDRLARLEEQLARTGLDRGTVAATVVTAGAPHAVLAALAEALEARLVVVGASEQYRALGLGSAADRIVREARCPVLVVRGDLPVPPRRVVAAVDLSALTELCLRRGLGVLEALGTPRPSVTVLHALEATGPAGAGRAGAELVEVARYERLADDALRASIRRVDPDGLWGLTAVLRMGPPREAILEQLADEEADLALLATHGHGGFIHRLLGSVAEGVARHAPCSVLLVPPAARR